MTPGDPGHALLAQLARGLVRHGQLRTQQTLGDRRGYVGLSDIGKGIECLRAAVANKVADHPFPDPAALFQAGRTEAVAEVLRRQLILQRGHWLESGIEAAFHANRTPLLPQIEIALDDAGVPIRAHLDFVLVRGGDHPAVRVLELKSTQRIPASLYPAYEAQLYGQLGLLAKQWGRPAFGLRDESGQVRYANLTFPDLVRQALGIDLPATASGVDLQGWVLCIAMSDAKPFGPYRPEASMLALCRRTARAIWETADAVRRGAAQLNDLAICPGFHPLCDCCPYAEDCPKFRGQVIADPALDRDLMMLGNLKDRRSILDAEIVDLETRIRRFCRLAGNSTDWLKTDGFRFRNARLPGRKSLNPTQLRASLASHLDPQILDTVIANATTVGAAYERLHVSPLRPAEASA